MLDRLINILVRTSLPVSKRYIYKIFIGLSTKPHESLFAIILHVSFFSSKGENNDRCTELHHDATDGAFFLIFEWLLMGTRNLPTILTVGFLHLFASIVTLRLTRYLDKDYSTQITDFKGRSIFDKKTSSILKRMKLLHRMLWSSRTNLGLLRPGLKGNPPQEYPQHVYSKITLESFSYALRYPADESHRAI